MNHHVDRGHEFPVREANLSPNQSDHGGGWGEGRSEVELRDYLRILRKFWRSISALALISIAAAAAISLAVTPTYTASTSLFLTVQSGNTAGELAQGSTYTERQVKSFAEIAQAPIVLQPVIDELGLEVTPAQLAQNVTVTVPTNTAILEVALVDIDPNRAAATANAIGSGMVRTVADVAPTDEAGRASVEANVITPATVPTSWTTPKVAQNLLLGLLVGLMLGVGQALLRTALDTKVRNVDDIARVTELPVVGTVIFDSEVEKHPLAVVEAPNSLRAEEYRRLRTNLQFLGVERGRTVAFTSSVAAEGKTSTILNVAVSLAEAGKRVLLVDADLRRPKVAERLNLEGTVGLSTILVGRADLDDVIQPVHGLDVLPSGQVPPNPSELLGSDALRRVLQETSQRYDYVLLDSAPLGPVADTAVLSSAIGGVIIIAGSGAVDAVQLQDAIASVEAADGHVLGVVLNKLKAADAGHQRRYYYQREPYSRTETETDTTAPTPLRPHSGRPMRAADVS